MARARGVKLGDHDGAAPLRAAVMRNADACAENLAPVVADIRADGATSLRAIAAEFNAHGMLNRRCGRRQVSNVRNLILRMEDT